MTFEDADDHFVLSTGKRFYAPFAVLGIDCEDDARAQIMAGYDTAVSPDEPFTPAERQEIAVHAIAQWTAWAAEPSDEVADIEFPERKGSR